MHGSNKAPDQPGGRKPPCLIASGHTLEQSLVGYFPGGRVTLVRVQVPATWRDPEGAATQPEGRRRQASGGGPAGPRHDD